MKRYLLVSVAVTALSSPAFAADFPRPVPVYIPPVVVPAPILDWSGFYIGGSVGARSAEVDLTTISIGGTAITTGNTASLNNTAFRSGGYVGFNWQSRPWLVVGIEGDIAWTDAKVSIANLPGAGGPNPGDSSTFRQLWDGSVRGRVGYLFGSDWLLYVTGGGTWQRVDATAACSAATCGTAFTQTNSTTRSGWTIGGGIEGRLGGNWFARGEYRYSDYGTWRSTFSTGATATVVDAKLITHTGLFGLSYKF